MGRNKALLPVHGEPLIRSIVSAVETAAGSAILVGSEMLYGHLGFRAIPDLYPGEGPLGAIVTALGCSIAEWNLVVACDMPELSAGFLSSLLRLARETDLDLLAPAGPSGQPEPLCAVYRESAAQPLRRAFERGERKAMAVFNLVKAGVIRFEEAAYFQNVNTPEEWALYAAERS
jgi:molybdopterin-guanine dinucleotide biosynthesis protein A